MFTLFGSSTISAIALIVCIFAFTVGAPVLGMGCIAILLVFGTAAFVKWADMTNV